MSSRFAVHAARRSMVPVRDHVKEVTDWWGPAGWTPRARRGAHGRRARMIAEWVASATRCVQATATSTSPAATSTSRYR